MKKVGDMRQEASCFLLPLVTARVFNPRTEWRSTFCASCTFDSAPNDPKLAPRCRCVGGVIASCASGATGVETSFEDPDNGGTTPPPPPPPPASAFAGTYATAVTLASNTCGPVTVQSLPTTVTHNAGSTAISMVHGGTTYSGTVAGDSSFTTSPVDVDVGDGFQYRITLAGRFGNRSFVADATVDRSGTGGPCRFVAHWVGTR